MQRYLLIVLLWLTTSVAMAQINDKSGFVVNENSLEVFSFDNIITDYSIDTADGFFTLKVSDDYSVLPDYGCPSLPVLQKIIAIPEGSRAEVELYADEVEEYSLGIHGIYQKMYPVQPSQFKNADNDKWCLDEKVYGNNSYYCNNPVEMTYMGIMRGMRLIRLTVSPFEYNPVLNRLRIHNYISADVKISDVDRDKLIYNLRSTSTPYSTMVLRNVANTKAYSNVLSSATDVPIKYVVVARDSFREALQPFVQWKIRQGFDVVEYYPHYAANRDTIRAKLSDMYHGSTPLDPAPTFLLIVGDVEQIHSFIGRYTIPGGDAHATDLYYAEYTGDIYPEVLFGRMSVNNISQLQAVINKTIEYEQYGMRDKEKLSKALLVAGKETRDPAPAVTNGQLNYLKYTVADNFAMDTVCYYNGTSHNQKEDILLQLSSIPGFVTYSGHCTVGGWSSPYITTTDMDTFSTVGSYSFVVNNCCKSSNFTSGVCFGEALLRRPNAGAIGVIGASNETLWNEDYYWSVGAKYPFSLYPQYNSELLGAFDRMFHVRNEDIHDYAITQGQMLQAGNMSVARAGSPYENYYWEIYNLLGDPSLMPFVGMPDTMTLNIHDTIRQGDVSIECSGTPWAHIAIYEDTVLLGATFLDQSGYGIVRLNKAITHPDILLTATAQYHIPIIDTIAAIAPTGAKVILSDYYFGDTMGNAVKEVYPNQRVYLYGTLSNIGVDDAYDVKFLLQNVVGGYMIADTLMVDTLQSNASYAGLLATAVVDNRVQNMTVFSMNAVACDSTEDFYNKRLEVLVSASKIEQSPASFKDSFVGAAVLALQPDSVYILEVPIANMGNHYSDSIYVSISTNRAAVVLSESLVGIPSLQAGDTALALFTLRVNNVADTALQIKIGVEERNVYNETTSYYVIGNALETFERGNFTLLEWDTSAVYSWCIDSSAENSYRGKYSARSAKIEGRQLSVLKLPLEVVADDTVSFWVKTSTEQNYDILTFYIDGQSKGSWSGKKSWKCYKYPIAKGQHQLMWKYQKDDETNSGSDAVWIDDLELPMAKWNKPIIPTDNELDIDDCDKPLAGRIYPNPAKNYVIFEFDTNSRTMVTIYDLKGVEVDSFVIDQERIYKHSTERYVPGVYTIMLKSNDKIQIEKLMIVK